MRETLLERFIFSSKNLLSKISFSLISPTEKLKKCQEKSNVGTLIYIKYNKPRLL